MTSGDSPGYRPLFPPHPELPLSATAISPPTAAGALAPLRVLDLSRVLAGPLCSMVLGDLGADVIKVERPGTGDETRQWGPPWVGGESGGGSGGELGESSGAQRDRASAYYLAINRNKRSVTADLASDAGRSLVRGLALSADVLIENFAPGTLDGWGLGYDEMAAGNPGLVYCSITGYGSTGPDADRPGYDFAIQAQAGWMSITGEPAGAPMKVGVALVDVLAGQNSAIAILAAIAERGRSGRGQRIEVSLLDSALAGLVNVGQAALVGAPVRRFGNAHATIVPYQAFDTSDRQVVIAVGNDGQWRRLCSVLGLPDLADDPRFATNPARVGSREILVPILAARLRERTGDAWLGDLREVRIPCAPVNSVKEAVADPAFVERGGRWSVAAEGAGTFEAIGSPLRLDRTPTSLRRPPPRLGEHTEQVGRDGWG